MDTFMTDLLTSFAVVINGIPQGLLALSFGFAAFPTSIAFFIGAAGSVAFNSVATISFQAETITLAGKMGRNIKERLSIVFWGALFLLVPSVLGLNETIVAYIGPTIVNSMMAGVGIMLAYVAMELFSSEKISGTISMITGIAVWFMTLDLAKTIIISVLISTIVYNILMKMGKVEPHSLVMDINREKFTFGNIQWKIWENPMLIVHALALACLNIGANISFGKITGGIAGVDSNIDHLAIYSSLADMGSSFFGGGPVEAIISGTATAPNPLRSSVIMMLIMAAILLFKLLPTIGKYVHSASIAGFLFVLGTFVTFASNIQGAIATVPAANGPFGFSPWGMVIGATVLVSAKWNPFFGLLAGVLIKMIFSL
ncbi:MAG: NCS2 family permease [Synergistaceae bacterium]|jgi:AGZA family xanthine/uracil permease-like MFS transporter|nr:NCS2 family permease [Synergistaceae bacterium]MDD3319174.1 NCS2 family permease [Synergistaceae bacterium]MDD3672530.1 NCS2 family permease [Synergistaceae bacterium]MDD3963784.1 NCS2 family permease [Synergistaceae bacterium]MDD4704691.1 NCS2 family permease [Synergistaceae bacterium]